MITLQIPNNNIPEREYIINTLLVDVLGLPCNIESREKTTDYSINFDGKEIVIKDCFFNGYHNAYSYLCEDALPKNVFNAKNEFTVEKDIPVIYGSNDLQKSENKIICGTDIFASSFFMLTRWEEHTNKKRDMHSRFPGEESTAYKNNFLNRAVVDEYVEMLWNMMQKLGYKGERKSQKFEPVLTHDVDSLNHPYRNRASVKALFGDVLKRKNPALAYKRFKYIVSSNPIDTFDFLMDQSESIGIKSHFYFMSSNSELPEDQKNYLESTLFSDTISKIKKRGHIIGFHPGYSAYNDESRWLFEKQMLEEAVQQEVFEGRQHYLRMDVTKTLPIWDKNNMKTDSTLGYADKEGFRCGTGEPFNVFDFLKRKKLNLKERPLIVMDATLCQYQNLSPEQLYKVFQYYISVGKKYRTTITMLFHNSFFCGIDEDYYMIYKEILRCI